MALKLSIFTTVSLPEKRGDNYKDALACYTDLADETVIVYGRKKDLDYPLEYQNSGGKTVHVPTLADSWPREFNWEVIGQHFQRGYEACTGDWVIHADLDFIFDEKDYDNIRETLERTDAPALSFYKYQFILPDRYNLKSRLVIAVNKGKYGDRIRFDSGGDLAQPSLDGQYISPDDVPESKIGFWNYEKITKTKEQIMDDVGRMERAYQRHFGHTQYGSDGTNQDAFKFWIKAQYGKLQKPQEHVKLEDHPKCMQQTIKNLKPEQWGYSAFGLEENDYVKGS